MKTLLILSFLIITLAFDSNAASTSRRPTSRCPTSTTASSKLFTVTSTRKLKNPRPGRQIPNSAAEKPKIPNSGEIAVPQPNATSSRPLLRLPPRLRCQLGQRCRPILPKRDVAASETTEKPHAWSYRCRPGRPCPEDLLAPRQVISGSADKSIEKAPENNLSFEGSGREAAAVLSPGSASKGLGKSVEVFPVTGLSDSEPELSSGGDGSSAEITPDIPGSEPQIWGFGWPSLFNRRYYGSGYGFGYPWNLYGYGKREARLHY